MTLSPLAVALPPGSACDKSSDAACDSLRHVYQSADFNNLDAQPGGETIFSWLGRKFSDFLNFLFSNLGTVPTLLIGALLVAGVIVLAVWRLRNNSGGRRIDSTDEVRTPLTDDPEAEWKAALRAAQAGDFREAIRRAFRSALLDVAYRGRFRVDASWTTRELLRSAQGDADLVASLAPAAADFDAAWYSGKPVAQQDWERARARCDAIRKLARRTTSTVAEAPV